MPHYRVLPPQKSNGMILEVLPINSQSFTVMSSATVSLWCCNSFPVMLQQFPNSFLTLCVWFVVVWLRRTWRWLQQFPCNAATVSLWCTDAATVSLWCCNSFPVMLHHFKQNYKHMIRYDCVYLMCSKKLMGSQLSLLHKMKKNVKETKKLKITWWAWSPIQSHYHDGSPLGRSQLRWERFVEKVGFEPKVKEWRSDGWRKWGWW